MGKQVTITLDDETYNGLTRLAGRKSVERYLRDIVQPEVQETDLEQGYRDMAADAERELEAKEWLSALAGDQGDEAR
jgi:predicted CopG family antitoxin